MKTPWIKTNPSMSVWLSGANKVAGAARGQAAAAVKREAARASKGAGRLNTCSGWRPILTLDADAIESDRPETTPFVDTIPWLAPTQAPV